MKYDVKKLREDLFGRPTLYCSAMAHLRGKLHMCKLNGGTVSELMSYSEFLKFLSDATRIADDRRHMFHWTMEDQEKLIGSILKEYEIEEVEE
jgi:hypothetical protein